MQRATSSCSYRILNLQQVITRNEKVNEISVNNVTSNNRTPHSVSLSLSAQNQQQLECFSNPS